MKFFIELYKNEIVAVFLISSLMLWGITATILAFQNKTKVILIGKTKNSYQLITETETTPIETLNFIRHFLSLTLNFNAETYKRHISLAGDLMTDELWKIKKSEFIKMAGFIKENKITQSAEILKIQKITENQFEINFKNYLFKNGILTEKKKIILLSITSNKRSYENPWSASVSNIEIK